MQETRISAAGWKECRYLRIGTFIEYQSIEHAIQQVAQGAGEDQCNTNHKPRMKFFLDDRTDIEDSKDHRNKPEKGECHLSPFSTKLPAPCHPFVFNEINLEPVMAPSQWP